MRKLLILLLAVLMPLQWSSAAVAALCLEELAGHGHGAVQAAGHGAAHAHAGHAHPSPGDGQHAWADGAGDPAGDDEQAGASTSFDGAGCCHAGLSLPPSGAATLPVQAMPPFAGPAPPMPPLSHSSEGPFRPPRAGSA